MMPIKWLAGAAPEHIHKLCIILKCTEVYDESHMSVKGNKILGHAADHNYITIIDLVNLGNPLHTDDKECKKGINQGLEN